MNKKEWDKFYHDCIENFVRLEPIKNIIILGNDGGIRNIEFADDDDSFYVPQGGEIK